MRRWCCFFLASLLSLFLFPPLIFAEDKTVGIIPKLPQTKNDPLLFNGHVYPNWGPVCQRYTYSVVYKDAQGRPPTYIKIYFNGKMIDMEKKNPGNTDYKKGVKYFYTHVPKKLGSNFYYFEASNGSGKTRDSIIDSPDNGPVLFESAFDQNEIVLIDKQTGKKIINYPTGKEWVGGVALSDDGKYLVAKTSAHIYLFDTTKPQKPLWIYNSPLTTSIGDVKGGIDISADGSRIFAAMGNMVLLFNQKSNRPKWKQTINNSAYNVAISADGRYMAAALAGEEENKNSNLLILFSHKSKKPLWQYHSSGNFHDVSLSTDGNFIAAATGCPDRRAYIFSKDSNQPIMRSDMLTRDSPVHRAKISADGSLAVFGAESDGGSVFLFSHHSTRPVWKFPIPNSSSVRALNFTPDGQYIGAATLGGQAYIFSKDSNKPLYSWNIGAALGAIDIADDGSFLATGGTDNKVHILTEGQPTGIKIPLSEYIQEIDISADGRYIAAGTGGSVYFFESFARNENKIFTCDQIVEPKPEGSYQMESDPKNNYRPRQLSWFQKIIVFIKRLLEQQPDELPIDNNQVENPGICGNGLCENSFGESSESCPRDCTDGN